MAKIIFSKTISYNTNRNIKTAAIYSAEVRRGVKINLWYFSKEDIFGFAFLRNGKVTAGGVADSSIFNIRQYIGIVELAKDKSETSTLRIDIIDENNLKVELEKW